MNDMEKSILLARARGWEVYETRDAYYKAGWPHAAEYDDKIWHPAYFYKGYAHVLPDFYARSNFELVWRFLNWVNDNASKQRKGKTGSNWITGTHDLYDMISFGDDLANNQRALLDKIFELCVEAGLIEIGTHDE